MKPVTEYKSQQEILLDPEIRTVNDRAKMIEEFRLLHANDPTPQPTPGPDEERTIRDLVQRIVRERDAWFVLDAKQARYAELLPAAVENQRTNQAAMEPDAPAAKIIEMLVAGERVRFMQNFLTNVSTRKAAVSDNLVGLFHRFNSATTKFSKQSIFLNGIDPGHSVRSAVAVAETILKK